MFKKVLFLALLACTVFACTDDAQSIKEEAKNEAEEQAMNATASESINPRDVVYNDFKEKSIPENDYVARVRRGMDKLMVHYKKAADVIVGFENPSYTIDEKCNTVFSYEENGAKYEKRFNMGRLAHAGGKMSLQADNGSDIPYPGFRIATDDDEARVEIYKDGKFVQKDNEWYIVLGDRPSVEKAIPTMVNVINICRKVQKEQ